MFREHQLVFRNQILQPNHDTFRVPFIPTLQKTSPFAVEKLSHLADSHFIDSVKALILFHQTRARTNLYFELSQLGSQRIELIVQPTLALICLVLFVDNLIQTIDALQHLVVHMFALLSHLVIAHKCLFVQLILARNRLLVSLHALLHLALESDHIRDQVGEIFHLGLLFRHQLLVRVVLTQNRAHISAALLLALHVVVALPQ
mmetsp:Transcript_2881/g.5375  ORF Transcript_2881/g.5375 Transcript_2881/m.5375 type:complete len:203 (+) Transcript_2881:649-1257(+)